MLSSYWSVLQLSHNVWQNNCAVILYSLVYCLSPNKVHLPVNVNTFYFTSSIPTCFGSNQTIKHEIKISREVERLISIAAYTSINVFIAYIIPKTVIVGQVLCFTVYNVCMYVCMYACMHACIHVCVCVCFTTCGHYCRWYPKSLWSKKFI